MVRPEDVLELVSRNVLTAVRENWERECSQPVSRLVVKDVRNDVFSISAIIDIFSLIGHKLFQCFNLFSQRQFVSILCLLMIGSNLLGQLTSGLESLDVNDGISGNWTRYLLSALNLQGEERLRTRLERHLFACHLFLYRGRKQRSF